MKKRYLKCVIVFAISLFLFIIPNKVSAATISKNYTIDSYDIDMVVNENNTFDITETIKAYFYVPQHGLYRRIPLRNSVNRVDGTKHTNIAKITNLSVSEDYTVSNENGYKVVKIGNANKTITGSHTYTIKYTYNIGKDPLKNSDELYFNLIGDEWDASISNVNFKITMPKSFDESLLGFSSGSVGSTNSSNVLYSVDENTIKGYLLNTLNAGEALTIRLTLQEGYFVGASSNLDTYSIIVIGFSILCVIFAILLWIKYGRDKEVIETVEFYPPEGYNSAEVGFLYEGLADNKSVISLLVYLADKGYLKIEETEEQILFSKYKNFKIIKLKEYDGNNKCERLFFNGLFNSSKATNLDLSKAREIMREAKAQGEKISFQDALEMSIENNVENDTVTVSDLYNRFYVTLEKIKKELNAKENKSKIFESAAGRKSKWLILMIVAIFVLITLKPMIEYSDIVNFIFALMFPGIGVSIMVGALIGAIKMPKVFAVIWGLMFGGMPWISMVLPALRQNELYLIMYIIGIICIVALIVFIKIIPKRTPYGNEMLGKVRGFKRFLETAEKPQLEALVTKDPEYFYNILPYTYALGVSDVWMNQFEGLAMQAPSWYVYHGAFSVHNFNSFMTHTMLSAQTAMASSPSRGGGGSSGGGSSGGGSGGGGGGSW